MQNHEGKRPGPKVIKLFFMLKSAEHEICQIKLLTIANSFLRNIAEHENFSAFVGIFICISREIFMLS